MVPSVVVEKVPPRLSVEPAATLKVPLFVHERARVTVPPAVASMWPRTGVGPVEAVEGDSPARHVGTDRPLVGEGDVGRATPIVGMVRRSLRTDRR